MTRILLAVLAPLQWLNTRLLPAGSVLAAILLALMVVIILTQVFFRYVLNSALPWPEEAARFLMLWMTGLAAPAIYRRGGFVAIDMLEVAIPKRAAALLQLVLLLISALVLVMALKYGWKHVNSGWLFNSASLRLPLEMFGMGVVRVKLAWMYMSIFVGFVLLSLVNLELILRSLIALFGEPQSLAPIPTLAVTEAE
ncbi:MAG: TRAP transporter small permease subunit [Paracoccus denitrificans]|uniref:TRAP transporter small permease protein n=1 Tax=Paracoccus denitrificans TaxID=266 RepID=A0A533I613_PARDE|nr:MAG: TRAP transporter small permease subunit [Paracoccus denitrificans]